MRRFATIVGCTILGALLVNTPALASPFTIHAVMAGTNEVPPNASPATGTIDVTLNGDLLTVDLTFSGLIGGNPAAAHIHCCVAPGSNVGVAIGFPGFPATAAGTYFHVFNLLDASIYTAAFLNNFGGGTAAGAEAAIINGLIAGRAYSNIHNAVFPGGEIRANLGPVESVPEPATLSLVGLGLARIALRYRRKAGASALRT